MRRIGNIRYSHSIFLFSKYIIHFFQGFWDNIAEEMITTYTPSVSELALRCKEVWGAVAEHKKARLESKLKEANDAVLKKAKKGKGRSCLTGKFNDHAVE